MRRLIIVCVLAAATASLPSVVPVQAAKKSRTPVTSSIKDLKVPPLELRIRVRALIRPTLGIIEEGVDRILENASDPAVRRGALRGKIETTTTLLSAMLRNDPVLALADAWGYALQLQAWLAKPAAKAVYGDSAAAASEALGRLEKEFRDLWGSARGEAGVGPFESRLRQWAADHPIEGAIYRRPSIDSEVAGLLASGGGKGGAFAALGNLEETTTDIMTRMDLYTMYLPRLARWEAELAVDDLAGGADPRTLAADLQRLSAAVDRIAKVAEDAPGMIESERNATLEVLRSERLSATADLRGERRAIVDALRQERIATLDEIESMTQRLADRSSGPVREAVHEELTEVVTEIEKMRGRLIEDSETALDRVVDHAFLRSIQLLLVAAVLAAAGVVLSTRFLRR